MHITPNASEVNISSLQTLSGNALENALQQIRASEDDKVYQTNPNIIVRQIGDEWLLVPTGELAQHFNGMVSINQFSYIVWKMFEKPSSIRQALEVLRGQYADSNHILYIDIRSLIDDYVNMNLFCEV